MSELSIGQLAARTGISVATLRTWEARHGFPAPNRTPTGRRIYVEQDVDAVSHVAAQRRAGLALDAAIQQVRRAVEERPASVFAALQAAQPDLIFHKVPKRVMVAMSRAMEDEYLSRGARGVVLASFQKERYYRQSEHRWRELARSAEIAAVYAAFPSARSRRRARPREIPLEDSSPVQREWAITCVSQLFTACLAGWQLPARPGAVDGRRVYETVWTTRPASVLQVLGTYVGLSRPHAPDLAERLLGLVEQTGRPPSNDGSVADALANRMVAYVIETLDRRAHAEVSGDRPAR